MTSPLPFTVSLTADFYEADGQPKYQDIGLDRLSEPRRFTVGRFADHRAEIAPEQLTGVNGVVVLTPRVTARSLAASTELLVVSRFGVGYDSVDVPACTAADVVLCIATGAVDRPVAEATVGWMLALTHHLRAKDNLVRQARWNDRSQFMGCELRERTLGVIGFGGIGRALVKLLTGFGMNPPLVYDPFASAAVVEEHGARSVGLDELLAGADFVSIHCALATRQIAGAALDCFAEEPLTAPPVLASFDNVLLAPHCIAWTDEMFRDIGRTACQSIVDLAAGTMPRGVVNPEVFNRPGFVEKWRRLSARVS